MDSLAGSPVRNLVSIFALLLVVVAASTLGYRHAGWSIGDSVYMALLIIYTVGYGEVHPIDTPYLHDVTIATSLGVLAPAIGGWALAALPLIGAPDVAVAPAAPGAFRAARPGLLIYLADGPFAAGQFYLWQVALFVSLGESFAAYGGAVALAALVGAACGLVLGRHVDAGHGRAAVAIAYAAAAAVTVLRVFSVGSPALAVAANAAGAIANALAAPAMMTAVYNLAKASPCPLRFNIVTEGAWDLGCGGAFLAAAALVRAGAPLPLTLLMGLPSAAILAGLLRRCYAAADEARAAG
jgi:hypothetical protein